VPDDHPPHLFMWGRKMQRCPGGTQHAATPPLVAASPVPPVVPDSDDERQLRDLWQEKPLDPTYAAMSKSLLWDQAYDLGWLAGLSQGRAGDWTPELEAKVNVWVQRRPEGPPSGSGVVPDKPALAPETCKIGADFPEHHHHASSADIVVICTRPEVKCHHVGVPLIPCPNASVPAVTDDEAATRVIVESLVLALGINPDDADREGANEVAVAVIAGLRSAGFLIVHHTKET
jgi:hypothetical protein